MGASKIILFPPFVHVHSIARLLEQSRISVGGQDCATADSGAFTGDVSARMLASVGAEYVIIGHSERRSYHSEISSDLTAKIMQALKSGLHVIYCVGETLEQREQSEHFNLVASQLQDCLFHLNTDQWKKIVIAYEPVWAIGTGLTASPAQAQEMHAFIRQTIAEKMGHELASEVSILYGGSCNESNAAELFALKDVDGGLIGGASLKSRSFVNILKEL
jgi:triosephosphate isomerase